MSRATVRAGLYARVSTEKQAAEDRTSIADQMRRNREVCERTGWTVADEYLDPEISGEELERRRKLTRLLADCEAGRTSWSWPCGRAEPTDGLTAEMRSAYYA